jgi:hypothetical protein
MMVEAGSDRAVGGSRRMQIATAPKECGGVGGRAPRDKVIGGAPVGPMCILAHT